MKVLPWGQHFHLKNGLTSNQLVDV